MVIYYRYITDRFSLIKKGTRWGLTANNFSHKNIAIQKYDTKIHSGKEMKLTGERIDTITKYE